MTRVAYRWFTRQLTRLFFGEYAALSQIGMAGMPNASRIWFLVAGYFARLAFLRIVRCEWIHFERIPDTGVIIASNHLSSADPAMMASAIYPRSPRYMAKVELFQKEPIIGYLFALSGAFPVRRGMGDRLALREAERLLNDGAVVGMFPEGHRSTLEPSSKLIPGPHSWRCAPAGRSWPWVSPGPKDCAGAGVHWSRALVCAWLPPSRSP